MLADLDTFRDHHHRRDDVSSVLSNVQLVAGLSGPHV